MTIETFIFFDLETTGLIKEKIMPKITEIALIAVARKSISNNNENSLPRVLHKLVIPVNPQKIVSSKVEYLTKLSNEDLQLQQPFNCNIYELIMHFLQRLTPPLCFASHNGNGFDYPILLWELRCINKILDNGILCIDTWKMFQDFFKKKDLESEIQDLLDDEYNDSLSALDMSVITKEIKDDDKVVTTVTLQNTFDNKICKIINDEKCKIKENNDNDIEEQSLNYAKRQDNERTPKNQIIRQQHIFVNRSLKNHSRKKLDFGFKEKLDSLKLSAIYKHMFNSNLPHEHSAEADCLAMIRCVINIAEFFLKWSDNHAIPLIYYKKI